MNYRKIYADIIRRAKERPKPNGYTEKHHIVPKSLGGSNEKSNIAILTAREHFLCHWLLVKMYEIGTEERKKMLCAFFFMRTEPNKTKRRFVSSRAYESYRKEYLKTIGSINSVLQKGEKNSMAGMTWYTNLNDGSTSPFATNPGPDWIEGRNCLDGQSCSILHIYKSLKYLNDAHERWDRFHSGNWESLRDFDNAEGRNPLASRMMFTNMIPLYKSQSKTKHRRFRSDKSLIGIYEKPNEDWTYGVDVKKEKRDFLAEARERWDRFHSGNWKSLSDFDKAEGRSPMASRMMFTKMIPIYKSQSKTKYRRFRSDKSLIGKGIIHLVPPK